MPSAAKERAKKDAQRAKEERALANANAIANALVARPTQKLRPAGFDGPAESSSGAPPSRGRPGSSIAPSVGQPPRRQSQGRNPSQGPSQGGRASSQARGTSSRMLPDRTELHRARQFAARFLDLPANAYVIDGGLGDEFNSFKAVQRPCQITAGKPAQVTLNSHRIKSFPKKDIFQYDVVVGSGVEKRIVVRKAWGSHDVQSKFPPGVIFDGNKLAWHHQDITGPQGEIRFYANLDRRAGDPNPPRQREDNTFRVVIKKTAVIRLASLQSYLDGQIGMDEAVINCITFLDHLLRETPSTRLVNIRRSFFDRMTDQRSSLGYGVEAMKGVYQSVRAAQGKHMVVNVDVSNAVFWNESSIMNLARELTGARSPQDLVQKLQPIRLRHDLPLQPSNGMIQVRKLKKNEFVVRHANRSQAESRKLWKVKEILQQNARDYKFRLKDKETRKETGDPISIEEYYMTRYNLRLAHPLLPLVEATKKGVVYPMEVCYMTKGQRYPYKLNEEQTAAMIKFAVERPPGRKASIEAGLKLLDWGTDKNLSGYGVSIDREHIKTNAHVLDAPTILFGKGKTVSPGYSGRWDLRNTQFLLPNNAPLVAWGVCVFPGRNSPNREVVGNFIKSFVSAYKVHGGIVQNANPPIVMAQSDIAKGVENTWLEAGNAAKRRPQMLVFVLPDKNADSYFRIKKSCDCRYGVVSQCMQGAQITKNNAQYHSNVCMKFNAKLGGTTSKVLVNKAKPMIGHFTKPTMIIGADVSHAAPGMDTPSKVAMTMSLDQYASRYAAAVQNNPARVELIATHNVDSIMGPLINHWSQNVGGGRLPQHVYYFRDGVSGPQYANVMKHEVAALKALLHRTAGADPNYKVNFTVIVAEKRHHIRFFPNGAPAADKNGNPVPGTVVDCDVTHPYEYDFYLNSHSAIQGTARPTHYHVLLDEEKQPPNQLVKMVYDHSYQYMRATTPVSLFPAVYYAHLASNRARAHENMGYDVQVKKASGDDSSSEKEATEAPKLLPIDPQGGAQFTMWFI